LAPPPPQIQITDAVAACDGGAQFREDAWVRADGGGGISRVLQGGKVWEKAGCNLSVVYGTMPPEALQAATERGVDRAKGMKPGEERHAAVRVCVMCACVEVCVH
jgi:coproporphyrinogen III oxidase